MMIPSVPFLLSALIAQCVAAGVDAWGQSGQHKQIQVQGTNNPNLDILNELIDARVELAKSIEREKSGIEKIEWQKNLCEAQTKALREHADLKVASEKAYNIHQQKNCDLRLQVIQANASSKAENLLEKLQTCKNGINLTSAAVPKRTYSPKMPQKLVQLSTGSYYISEAYQKNNWYMASLKCKSYGMELASVETSEENDALYGAIAMMKESFYISGSDLGSEGRFYWASTGEPFGNYNDWTGNRVNPSNTGGSEHCVHIHWHPRGYGEKFTWNDINCNNEYRFICE